MKPIEKNRLEQLLEIIKPAPALRIAHFTQSGEEMTEILCDFCTENGYEYQINCTDPSFYETLSAKYAETPDVKCINFKLSRPKYMIQGKLYEYLFVTSAIPEADRSAFLQKTHGIIKNAGIILIFLQKGDRKQRYDWTALLEEHYYVASSTIDDLFEHYDILISKKMHGWGG
jgi:hypothetical protein